MHPNILLSAKKYTNNFEYRTKRDKEDAIERRKNVVLGAYCDNYNIMFLNLKLIKLSKRPDNDFYHKISLVITHELIHKTLREEEDEYTSKMFDNLKRKLLDYGTD